VVRYRDSLGGERSKSFDKLDRAKVFQAEQAVGKSRGEGLRATPSELTLREYAARYVESHPEWRESTAESARANIRSFDKALGGRLLSRITTTDVRQWLGQLQALGLADSTIDGRRHLLATIYRSAIDDGLVTRNPVSGIKSRQSKRTRSRTLTAASTARQSPFLTLDEIEELSSRLPSWWRPYLRLLNLTGMRPAEAAGLTADRLDLDVRKILIVDRQLVGNDGPVPIFGPPKTESSTRVLSLAHAPELRVFLRDHLDSTPLGPEGLLFTSRHGTPFRRGLRGEAWRAAVAGCSTRCRIEHEHRVAMDLPESVRGWHSIRHSWASRTLAAGADVASVSALLGHANIEETVRTYLHADPERLSDALGIASAASTR
jgi:integrase